MMLIGAVLTPFSAQLAERSGRKGLIVTGLSMMTTGLIVLGGPLVSPPATAILLDAVPEHRAGTASGVFNTSRQVGGALAVAVLGGLLAEPATFLRGVHTSLLIAATVLAVTALASLRLHTSPTTTKETS